MVTIVGTRRERFCAATTDQRRHRPSRHCYGRFPPKTPVWQKRDPGSMFAVHFTRKSRTALLAPFSDLDFGVARRTHTMRRTCIMRQPFDTVRASARLRCARSAHADSSGGLENSELDSRAARVTARREESCLTSYVRACRANISTSSHYAK